MSETNAAPTDWIDGHPQLEAIAAAVWERCEHHDSGLIVDDPRNIAVAALGAVLAVLPPPADRADIVASREWWKAQAHAVQARAEVDHIRDVRAATLRDAADRYTDLANQNEAYDREQGDLDEDARVRHDTVRDVAAGLRRLADEAQQPECGCDPAPHREDDGTYSHWAGCPMADAQQQADHPPQPESRQ